MPASPLVDSLKAAGARWLKSPLELDVFITAILCPEMSHICADKFDSFSTIPFASFAERAPWIHDEHEADEEDAGMEPGPEDLVDLFFGCVFCLSVPKASPPSHTGVVYV